MHRQKLVQLAITLCVLSIAGTCFAGGTGMPWEGPLQQILHSITGPTAKVIGVLAIVAVGLAMAFSEGGGMLKKMLNVVMGLCIAFSASSFFLDFFGYSSGFGF